jgi:hypothetical protein
MFRSPPKGRAWRAWAAVAAWTLFIYTAIPFARAIQSFVKEHLGTSFFTWVVCASVAAGVAAGLRAVWRMRPFPVRGMPWLAAVAAAYLYWTHLLRENPEEALHFVEYGILGLLVFRAFAYRVRDPSIYVSAALVGACLGTIDEAIQWLTPRRYWDYRDIFLNVWAGVLMQAGIGLGLRPSYIRGPAAPATVRLTARLAAAWLTMIAVCLANTDRVWMWYRTHLATVPLLGTVDEVMTEFGYRHRDPAIGEFSSRIAMDELLRQDRERGTDVAAVLDRYLKRRAYDEFLATRVASDDPFLYEARIHLFSRDRNFEKAMDPKRGAAERAECMDASLGEKKILEAYFSNTVSHTAYRLHPAYAAAAAGHIPTGLPFRSDVSRGLIARFRPLTLWTLVLGGLLAALGVERYCGKKARFGAR